MDPISFPVSLTRRERTLGAGYYLAQVTVLPLLLAALLPQLFPQISTMQVNLCFYCINFACILWIFRGFLAAHLRFPGARGLRLVWISMLALAGYEAISSLLTPLLYRLDPSFYNVNDAAVAEMVRSSPAAMAIATVLLVPPAEELIFRGLIFGCAAEKSGALGYALSCALFALVHILGYVGAYSPAQLACCFVQYLPAGIALAWAYHFSGSIFSPIAIHALINAMSLAGVLWGISF